MSSITATYTSGQNLLEGLNSFLTVGHTTAPVYTTANALTTFTPGTGWTGNDTAGYVHATGNTATLTESTLLTIGTTYTLNITVTSYTSGSISYSVGGFSSDTITSSYTRTFVATATTALTITPTTDFVGTILLSLIATPVSNGYIDDAIGTASSTWELITITLTSPTAFTVVGSSSGSLGTGTVGILFSSSVAVFTVTAGTTAFAANDVIQLQMTAPWTALVHAQASQYTWQAPGNDNNGGPVVGLLCSSNSTANYFDAQVVGYPTWQPALSESLQWKRWAGAYIPLGPAAGQTCIMYARADGKCCVFSCLIGSTFTTGIIGWMDAEHGIDQHPQPIIIGGSALTQVPWSDSSVRGPIYPINPVSNGGANNINTGVGTTFSHIFKPNGRWAGLSGYTSYSESPENHDYLGLSCSRAGSRFEANIDGSFPQFPIDLKTSGGYAVCNPVYVEQGYWGKIPFLRSIPCYTSASALIGGGTIFRDNITRRRSVTLQNGYVVDGNNTHALELA